MERITVEPPGVGEVPNLEAIPKSCKRATRDIGVYTHIMVKNIFMILLFLLGGL
jgi:hypothetical protein